MNERPLLNVQIMMAIALTLSDGLFMKLFPQNPLDMPAMVNEWSTQSFSQTTSDKIRRTFSFKSYYIVKIFFSSVKMNKT